MEGPDRKGRRRTLPTPVSVALSAGAALCAAWALSRAWFYYDDFWNLSVADDMGFGWQQLTHSVLGHFYPGYNLSFWMLHAAGTGGFTLAVLLTLGGVATIGLLTSAVTRLLGASRSDEIVSVAATLAFGGWASVLLWVSASTNSTPGAIFSLATLWCHLRWLDSRRPLWAVLTGLAFGTAIGFYETALFILGPIVCITIVTHTTGGVAARLRRLLGMWRLWIAYSVPVVGLGIAFALGPYGEDFGRPAPPADVARLALKGVLDGFGTSTIGLHPGRFDLLGSPVASNLAAAAVLVGGLALLWRRVGSRAVWVPVAVLSVVLPRFLLVGWGRLGTLGWALSHDVRYYADLAWVLPVSVVAALHSARHPPHPDPPTPDPAVAPTSTPTQRPSAPPRRLLAGTAALTMAVVSLWHVRVAVDQAPSVLARRWRDAFVASDDHLRQQGIRYSLLDTLVPASVLGPQFGFFTHLSRTLPSTVDGLEFNDPDLPLYAPDFDGHLIPVGLTPAASMDPTRGFTTELPVERTTSGRGACWTAGGGGTSRVWIPLSTTVARGFWVVRLELGEGSNVAPGTVGVLAAGVDPIGYIAFQRPIDWTRRRVLLTSNSFAATQLGFDIPAGRTLCVTAGTVLRLDPPSG